MSKVKAHLLIKLKCKDVFHLKQASRAKENMIVKRAMSLEDEKVRQHPQEQHRHTESWGEKRNLTIGTRLRY